MAAYWAIGTYWGKAQSNNKKGHLIGHIKDIGYDPSQPTTRLYATHAAQPWHNDSSDQVGEQLEAHISGAYVILLLTVGRTAHS